LPEWDFLDSLREQFGVNRCQTLTIQFQQLVPHAQAGAVRRAILSDFQNGERLRSEADPEPGRIPQVLLCACIVLFSYVAPTQIFT